MSSVTEGESLIATNEALFASLYGELRRLAHRRLAGPVRREMGTTTLLHEAYLRLSNTEPQEFSDSRKFLGYAGRVMRSVIVDHVRAAQAHKRGAKFDLTTFSDHLNVNQVDHEELKHLNAALHQLALRDDVLARVVELKFFCGLSFQEIASILETSERTVQRQWRRARLYLYHALKQC